MVVGSANTRPFEALELGKLADFVGSIAQIYPHCHSDGEDFTHLSMIVLRTPSQLATEQERGERHT